MHESFWGVPCLSGDDKRLTTLTLEHGYLTYMQRTAVVWSTFPDKWSIFFKQRVRWARGFYQTAKHHRHAIGNPRGLARQAQRGGQRVRSPAGAYQAFGAALPVVHLGRVTLTERDSDAPFVDVEDALGPAQADRREVRRVAGQRLQDGGRLAARLASSVPAGPT